MNVFVSILNFIRRRSLIHRPVQGFSEEILLDEILLGLHTNEFYFQ